MPENVNMEEVLCGHLVFKKKFKANMGCFDPINLYMYDENK